MTEKELQQTILDTYSRTGNTVACAESCTGGLIAKLLTDLSGSSRVFVGGFVTYCDEMKVRLLGVSRETLDRHHAVSAEVAKEMAHGALKKTGATVAVSATGVAGPSSDDSGKPVGTVYIGLARANEKEAVVRGYRFEGSRESVREQAAKQALLLLLEQKP